MRRILSFAVLAALYFPGCTTSKNAVRCLSRWIKDCNPLTKELVPTGYMPYNHRYLTMKQYKIKSYEFLKMKKTAVCENR